MRHRPAPAPPDARRVGNLQTARDVQLSAWRQRRGFAEQAHKDPTTLLDRDAGLSMSEDALTYLLLDIESRRDRFAGETSRGRPDIRHLLIEQMRALTPKLGQPAWTSDVEDLGHVWSQPEMLDFWHAWQSEQPPGARGPDPLDPASKAFASVMAMLDHTHGTSAYDDVFEKQRLQQVFAGVELAAAQRENARRHADGRTDLLTAPGPFQLPLYAAVMDRKEPLTRRRLFRHLRLSTQAAMFRTLCELHPGEGFGENLLIDGCLFPAWCKQVGKGATDEQELLRRCKTPHAGARVIRYTSEGKRSLDDREVLSGRAGALLTSANFARGYYYVCIVDQASGWPLVSLIMDASFDEAEALIPLLSDLYRHYGDFIRPKHIAGDGAWDEEWAHRLCELFYGLAPVFRHTQRAAADTELAANASRSVKGFTHEGRLRCLDHNRLMPMAGFDAPALGSLRPGQGASGHPDSAEFKRDLQRRERAFRLRALDQHGPGPAQRLSLAVHLDWRRLNRIPRHPYGQAELYAFRQALQMRLRNQMEGHFSRMQTGCKLATYGADRVRVRDWETVEAFLGLAELRMCALSLADVRVQAGQPAAPLPDAPVGPLPIARAGGSRAAACRTATPPVAVAAGPADAAATGAHTALPPAARLVPHAPAPAELPATADVPVAPRAERPPAVASPLPAPYPSTSHPSPLAALATQDEPECGKVIVVDFRARRRA